MDDKAEEIELLEAQPLKILTRQHHGFALSAAVGAAAFLYPMREFHRRSGGGAYGRRDGSRRRYHGVLVVRGGVVIGCEADLAEGGRGGGREGERALGGGAGGGATGAEGVRMGFVVIKGKGRGITVRGVSRGEWSLWRECREQHLVCG